jgi:hypothetical protein
MAVKPGRARARMSREQTTAGNSAHDRLQVSRPTLAVALEVIHDLLEETIPGSSHQ